MTKTAYISIVGKPNVGKSSILNKLLGQKIAIVSDKPQTTRTRIMGVQLYKFDMKGFLQWGYNFYYSQFSLHTINPYLVTDSEGAFPAGDAFSVYPGANGAVASLRLKVFKEALQDMMALKLLESYIGKEEVLKLIDEEMEVDFNVYPKRTDYILKLREKVNDLIKKY